MTVTHNQIKNISINNLIIYKDLQKYLKRLEFFAVSNNFIPHVFWCKGWILDYNPFEETEYVQRERVERSTFHLRVLIGTRMRTFTDKLELKNGGHILFTDTSEDPFSNDLADFLSENYP